tara:strand:+ start:226 stop:435 length:210 start_codon:yes stop_codon:yes gene_type:complete
MPYHIKKRSILSEGVPTDGTVYYTESGKWSNQYENRALFDSEDIARAQVQIQRLHGVIDFPPETEFVSE